MSGKTESLPSAIEESEVERILAADPWLARLTAADSPLGIMVSLTQREAISECAEQASASCAAHWGDLRRQLALRALPPGDANIFHAEVLRVVERLIPEDPDPNSTEGIILVALAEAVEKYEKSRFAPSQSGEITQHDALIFKAFWDKYALGSKMLPSCLKCGHAKPREEWSITHAELPDIYICKACVGTPSSTQRIESAHTPEALAEFWRKQYDDLYALINSPETGNFDKGVPLECAHQVQRWGEAHDRSKSAENWYWLVGYLAGKALRASISGDREKALHHTISAAAALRNWHKAIKRDDSGAGIGEDEDLAALESTVSAIARKEDDGKTRRVWRAESDALYATSDDQTWLYEDGQWKLYG